MTTAKPRSLLGELAGLIEVHDRYSATGRPRPNPKTVCKGKCEGMGCYPDNAYARAHGLSAADTPFRKCPRCKGTGLEPKKKPARSRR
jgi:hypothetical protein